MNTDHAADSVTQGHGQTPSSDEAMPRETADAHAATPQETSTSAVATPTHAETATSEPVAAPAKVKSSKAALKPSKTSLQPKATAKPAAATEPDKARAKASKKAAPAAVAAKPAEPKRAKAEPAARKPEKPVKAKLVRDSFTMPQADFDLLDVLKQRALNFRHSAKKGELLRAGLQALASLSEAQLQSALERVTPLKPGRPKKAD